MNMAVQVRPTGATPAAAVARFDYTKLDPDIVDDIRRAADSIKYRETCIGNEIIGIGTDLLEVKSKLDHGQFGKWLSAEFDWDERTARRFMSVADAFRGKPDTVSDLMPTTLYALAASSTPAGIRDEIVHRRQSGERLADHAIKSMIRECKQTEARVKRRRNIKAARDARQSPAAIRRAEAQRRADEERQRKRYEAFARIVALINERLGDAMPDLLVLLEQVGPGGLWGLPKALAAAGSTP